MKHIQCGHAPILTTANISLQKHFNEIMCNKVSKYKKVNVKILYHLKGN